MRRYRRPPSDWRASWHHRIAADLCWTFEGDSEKSNSCKSSVLRVGGDSKIYLRVGRFGTGAYRLPSESSALLAIVSSDSDTSVRAFRLPIQFFAQPKIVFLQSRHLTLRSRGTPRNHEDNHEHGGRNRRQEGQENNLLHSEPEKCEHSAIPPVTRSQLQRSFRDSWSPGSSRCDVERRLKPGLHLPRSLTAFVSPTSFARRRPPCRDRSR